MADLGKWKDWMNRAPNFNLYNGIRFTVVEEGYCECQVDITHNGLNPQGVAHGSLLFTLCDCVTGMAAATSGGGRNMLTQSATIHYLRPADSGTLTAKSRALRIGETTALVKGEVFDERGRLLATSEFTVWYTGEPVVLPGEGKESTWN
jgi:acyl-CoA thioesterase